MERQIYNKSTTDNMLGMRTLTSTVVYSYSKFKAVKQYENYRSSKTVGKKVHNYNKKSLKSSFNTI